jgi:threonine dehydratase
MKKSFNFSSSEIFLAANRLKNHILRTPLLYSSALSKITGGDIYMKMECWQLTGSFKVRGAINMVSALTEEEKNRGLVTASSGNHGTALSYAASILGYPPTKVFVPTSADPKKVEKIRSYGAEAVLYGENYLEALDEAQRYVKEIGGTYVHSHSHPLIIAGQATIGLEIMEDLPEVQIIMVPIGGGGLISGIGKAVKSVSEKVRIVGVEATAAPGAYLSLRDGYCHERIEIQPSVADGLLGTFTPMTFEISKNLIESVKLVEEDEIIHALQVFQKEEQLMIEGSSSVGLAAILSGKIDVKDQKVILILTGRNIDAERYNKLICSETSHLNFRQ